MFRAGEAKSTSTNRMNNTQVVIQGMPASRGKTVGIVCVVRDEKDFVKFQKGNVLVSKMTNPMFTPLISLASAVVTDIGSTLSHAAIVSREYGIPCIVGTKTATADLQDGDLVEVDADNGIVKIFRREE